MWLINGETPDVGIRDVQKYYTGVDIPIQIYVEEEAFGNTRKNYKSVAAQGSNTQHHIEENMVVGENFDENANMVARDDGMYEADDERQECYSYQPSQTTRHANEKIVVEYDEGSSDKDYIEPNESDDTEEENLYEYVDEIDSDAPSVELAD